MTLRAHTLETAFLWQDLGWLRLRLAEQTDGQWHVFAHATCGPWQGNWCVRTAPERTTLAAWMACLPLDEARHILLDHPPFLESVVA